MSHVEYQIVGISILPGSDAFFNFDARNSSFITAQSYLGIGQEGNSFQDLSFDFRCSVNDENRRRTTVHLLVHASIYVVHCA